MSINFILIYSTAVFIASIIPGPSMLLALTHGMQYGAKKSVVSAMGNVTVTLVQALVSIAGLGTVLMASEALFYFIKLAGAAYLICMGIRLFCSSEVFGTLLENNSFSKAVSRKKLYLQAVFVTAGNPKAIIFFTAVFPQFIDPEAAFLFQSSILLGLCAIIAFICFMIYAICGQKILYWFSQVRVAKFVKKVIGASFIGAGVGLAFGNR